MEAKFCGVGGMVFPAEQKQSMSCLYMQMQPHLYYQENHESVLKSN